MGTTIQRTPVSLTTSACSRNLGSAELIAVSVTIVLIASRLMIRRSGPGRCQAPRTSLSRDDHLHPLLEPDVTARDQQDPRAKAQGKYQTQDQAAREPTLHSPNLSQDARIPDRRIRSPCDQTPDDSVVLLQPDDSSAIRALTRLATRLNQAGQIVATRPIQATPTRLERARSPDR